MTDLQKALNEAMQDLKDGIIKSYSLTRYNGVFHGYTLTVFFDNDNESYEFSPQEEAIF